MRISVIMPAYNEERFIAEAIESVLAQTWKDFELIVLDDGSRDRTMEIAQSHTRLDPRVRAESHANMGVALTLNRGLEMSTSEWVVVMHADDVMMPNRIERQLAFVAAHPELAVASSWVKHIDSQGKVIAKDNSSLLTHEAVEKLYLANEMIGFNHPAAILLKSAVQAAGGYRPQLRVNEDVDLWNRLLERGNKILVQPEYLLHYRIHGGRPPLRGRGLSASSFAGSRIACCAVAAEKRKSHGRSTFASAARYPGTCGSTRNAVIRPRCFTRLLRFSSHCGSISWLRQPFLRPSSFNPATPFLRSRRSGCFAVYEWSSLFGSRCTHRLAA